jgi:hypothetical protein
LTRLEAACVVEVQVVAHLVHPRGWILQGRKKCTAAAAVSGEQDSVRSNGTSTAAR